MTHFWKSKRLLVLMMGLICIVVLGGVRLTSSLGKVFFVSNSTTNNAGRLLNYKTTYVGDSSKVVNIINNLPNADWRRDVSLQTQNIPYRITVNYDFSSVTMDKAQVEPTLRNSAIAMFSLIDNVDIIKFMVNVRETSKQTEYQYTRAEVQQDFEKKLQDYAKDSKMFEEFLNNLNLRLFAYPKKYMETMSSTPGIRISAEYLGKVDMVCYSTVYGAFLTWDSTSGNIAECGKYAELPYDARIYWTPATDNSISNVNDKISVKVAILDENKKLLAEKQLKILYDGSYTVQSSSDVVIGVAKNWAQTK